MAKILKQATAAPVRTVGVADPAKIALYDELAQFLANSTAGNVSHVKPRSYKVANDEGKMVTRKTGSYGLAFDLNGRLATLEVVIKADNASMEDFIVEATTSPEA